MQNTCPTSTCIAVQSLNLGQFLVFFLAPLLLATQFRNWVVCDVTEKNFRFRLFFSRLQASASALEGGRKQRAHACGFLKMNSLVGQLYILVLRIN